MVSSSAGAGILPPIERFRRELRAEAPPLARIVDVNHNIKHLMCDVVSWLVMRTTLDIDDDVLNAAKELAALRKTSAGSVLSELARQALRGKDGDRTMRNGVPLLPPCDGARPVSSEDVERMLEEP